MWENQDCMNSYAKLGHLPGPVRGVLWMMLSCLFYALIYVVVRGLAESFAVNQIVFFRAVLGSAFMLPWLFTAGLGALYTRRMPTYLWRMLFSYVGAVAWMYGIAGMPIADANALMFTMPLFTVILAAIWLAERPGIHRISATIVGFAGALIILRPGMIEISMAALARLLLHQRVRRRWCGCVAWVYRNGRIAARKASP